jgi:hypothetical protein
MRKLSFAILVLTLLACFTACSSNPPGANQSQSSAKPAEPKAPDLSTGREAFQRLYVPARGWAADAQPFRLQSETTSDSPGHDGKSGVWRASFASPSRRSLKAFVLSGVGDAKDRGVTPGSEDTYNPSNASTKTFDVQFLKIDSDKAFDVAQQKGGDKLLKETAKLPVFYILDWDPHENLLIWHVIYGENRNDAKLRIAVNATTGAFIRKER